MKHTKGPWHLDIANDGSMAIIPEVGFTICPLNPRIGFESDIPNFQLMAAAPELLEALIRLSNAPDCNEDTLSPETIKALDDAHNAIAKATGTK